jgi:hypothetical protein
MFALSQMLGWSSEKSFWFEVTGYGGLTSYKERRQFVTKPGDFFSEIFG